MSFDLSSSERKEALSLVSDASSLDASHSSFPQTPSSPSSFQKPQVSVDQLMKQGLIRTPERVEGYAFSWLRHTSHEIPKSGVVQWSGLPGSGKTEGILTFLSEHPELKVAWIEESMTVYPCAFEQRGVDLERVIFLESGRNFIWSALQVLRSQLFQVVVLAPETLKELKTMDFRRLQLASRQSASTLLLMTNAPDVIQSWTFSMRLWFQKKKLSFKQTDLPSEIQVLKDRFQVNYGS